MRRINFSKKSKGGDTLNIDIKNNSGEKVAEFNVDTNVDTMEILIKRDKELTIIKLSPNMLQIVNKTFNSATDCLKKMG